MKRVGFLGAYSIDNAGDQLLGYAVRQAFRERVPGVEGVLLAPAFRGDMWRHAWGKERGLGVEIRKIPADDSTSWARGLDAVVIGGGELVRLEPDFRPFLLGEASDWDPGIPAAWSSVGAENAPYLADRRPVYRAVKRCCEALAYASVRNLATARFVRRCGFTGALPVVPDPTMLLRVPAGEADRGDAILRDAKVDTGRFVVGVSIGASLRDPRAAQFYKELFQALAGLATGASACEIVLFPFGDVYGDVALQRLAHAALPAAKIVAAPIDALDRWRLVGALDLYVCTRYHAMLAAFAQDVPFVVLDDYFSDVGATSKIREFVAANDLEGAYLCPYVSSQPGKKLLAMIAASQADDFSFAPLRAAQEEALGRHYDAMIAALGLAGGG